MITKYLTYMIAIVMSLSVHMVHAGQFSVSCSYTNDNLSECASIVSDVVTDKFIAKFPSSKFQIFVHSNVSGFTNGGFSAYAVAGVIPRDSRDFPNRRYSSTNINGSDRPYNQLELAEIELKTYRMAVKNLMDACELSTKCDVYKR